jgi:CheY-like chemotaxis protein
MKSRQLQSREPFVILMVDDNEHGLVARKTVLKQNGYEVVTATSAEAGLDLFDRQHFDLVVTDYRMGYMDGIAFIGYLRQRSPATPVILLSGFVEPLGLDERSTGADAVMAKCSTEATTLVRTVARLLGRRTMRKPMRRESGVLVASARRAG